MAKFADVAIPRRLKALQRDRRGYPVPFIVLRDKDGRARFTVNDSDRVLRCILEKRCAICGGRLDSVLWFVGGPSSAFHARGAYLDTALHHDCMTYAMRVCPYLAAPVYSGRVDMGTLSADKVPDNVQLIVDQTMIPERPSPFVCVAARTYSVRRHGHTFVVRPERPHLALEFWEHGKQLDPAVGLERAKSAVLPDDWNPGF